MLDRSQIIAAYELFLDRSPESEKIVQFHLDNSENIAQLRERFISSPEFYKINKRFIQRLINRAASKRGPMSVNMSLEEGELSHLFHHVQQVWSQLGKDEPHYSVLSAKQYKPENICDNSEAFDKTGEAEVDALFEELALLDALPSSQTVFYELGCGVGRVTKKLAMNCDTLFASDVSKPHLSECEKTLEELQISNVELQHLESVTSFKPQNIDLFYSRIVLQHNPPPVQEYFLRCSLKGLAKGGIAVFQTVTHVDGYNFDYSSYIEGAGDISDQELHPLPLDAITDLARSSGCSILNFYQDGAVNALDKVSTKFILRKN